MLINDNSAPSNERTGAFPAQPDIMFKALADNAPDMIARLDREQRYLYVNPLIEEITGLPAQAFLGKSNHDLDLPDDLTALWAREVAQVFEDGQQGQFRFDAMAPDGKRYYDVRLAPEPGCDGAVTSVLAVVRDVTEFEWARQTLQRYTDRVHIMNQVGDAMRAAHTAEAVAAAVLPYSQQLLGCPRASVALYDRQAREAILLAVYTCKETKLGSGLRLPLEWNWLIDELAQDQICTIPDLNALQSPTSVLRTWGEEGVRSLVLVPLVVQEKLIGSLNLGMSSLQHLTPETTEIAREMANQLALAIHQADLYQQVQQHAEMLEQRVAKRTAALRASEARFRTIFETAALGIALVDMEGRIISSNPALQEMLGYDARELVGMEVEKFIHPDDIAARNRFFQELTAGKRNQFTMEKRYIRKDGTLIWVRPTVSLVRSAQGGGPYAIKLVDDITEERRMREALIQTEKLNVAGQLGATLAHEISNPLQAVIGALGLAAETLDPEDPVCMFIEIATEELERAAGIVAHLRDLNRKSAAHEKKPVQLNEIVEKILVLNKKRCETQRIDVAWKPDTSLPVVTLAPGRIRQVCLNLMLNAIEAMPEGGRLRVSTARSTQTEEICITFTDSGRGIDPDLQPHLFEPFHSSRPDGLGLGLYISKTIVEEHGGRIDVDSKMGQGASFTVWLPQQVHGESRRAGENDG